MSRATDLDRISQLHDADLAEVAKVIERAVFYGGGWLTRQADGSLRARDGGDVIITERFTLSTSPSGSQVHVYVPATIGSSYAYGGQSYSYHPESYWVGLGAPNPNNPYDARNYSNPFSPFYNYHMAYAGTC